MCYHARDLQQETGALKNISSPERDIDENCAGNFIIANTNNNNNNKRNSSNRYQLGNTEPTNNCDSLQERRLRQLRRQADWQWLSACIGTVLLINHSRCVTRLIERFFFPFFHSNFIRRCGE